MKRKHRRRKESAEVNLGFQIAPMIDVVFVILLFFIVQASDIQVEMAHVTKLPGTVSAAEGIITPDEISVRIEEDGQVYLNDDLLDNPEVKELPELASSLNQLRESSEASKAQVLVTIYANELAKYKRVVQVLDALARARISNVSFQAGSNE